jgi:ketosteroid isomerase-like protein
MRVKPKVSTQGAMEMRSSSTLALATFMLAVAGLVPLNAARAANDDENGVRQANEQFYAALNTMFEGNVEPMLNVWSHADDVTYMGPDGEFTVGWDQVSNSWTRQAALKLGGKVRPEGAHVTVGQDIATVECFEIGENFIDGQPQKVSLRATNVFRNENGQWKMIGHHTDLLPFLTK